MVTVRWDVVGGLWHFGLCKPFFLCCGCELRQASFLGFISLLSRISWLLALWPPEDCVPFRFYLKEMIVLALFIHTVSAAEWRALLLEGR